MTSICVIGSASNPPSSRGDFSRNSPASCSARQAGSGSVPMRSASSAHAASVSAIASTWPSRWARSSASSVGTVVVAGHAPRKSSTSGFTTSGCSHCGTCPAPAMISTRAPGMWAAKSSA